MYLRLFKGNGFSSFVSVSLVAAFGLVIICCGLGLCHSAVTAVLSITLWRYSISVVIF